MARRVPDRPSPLWPALVALVAVAAFANALGGDFALDDVPLVRDNPSLRSPVSIAGLLLEPYWPGNPAAGLYRPVVVVSFAINRAVTGSGALGFHLVNVLLHALAAALTWYWARDVGRHYGTALATALFFAVHPLHAEAVANIAGRAELLAAVFTLAAWLVHRHGRDAAGLRWPAVAAALWLLGVLSKEHVVLAPVLFWLDDRLSTENERPRRSVRRFAGYGVAVAVALALRFIALGGLRAPQSTIFLDNPPAFLGPVARVATALWVQLRYLWLAIWPARLSSDYSLDAIPPVTSIADARLWAGLLLVALGVALFAYGWRRCAPLALGVATWIVLFLPTANVLFATGTLMAERLAYFPLMGACLVAGHGVARLAASDSPLPGRLRAGVPIALTVVAVLALGVRSWTRNPAWHDNATLALRDVEVQPRSAKLQAGAGLALAARGDAAGAEAAFRRAVSIYPDYAQMHFNLGQLLMQRGASVEAIEHLARAVAIAPDNPRPYKSLAPLLEQAGRREEALAAWAGGAGTDPADLGMRFNHGRALVAAGRVGEARAVLAALAADAPGTVPGEVARGMVAELDGDVAAALRAYRTLLGRADLPAGIRRNLEDKLRGR